MADPTNPIPSPQPGDSEDVELALETAQRMYTNKDLPEALKWLRRAANFADEAGDDLRQLQLARLAADLAAVVDAGPQVITSAPSLPPTTKSSAPSRLPQPPSKHPPPAPSGRPSVAPTPSAPASASSPVASGGPPPLTGSSSSKLKPAPIGQGPTQSTSDSQPPPAAKATATTSIKPKPSESAATSTPVPVAAASKPAVSVAPTSAGAIKVERSASGTPPAAAFGEVKAQGSVRVAVRVSARDENLYIVRPLAQGQKLPPGSREARLVFE